MKKILLLTIALLCTMWSFGQTKHDSIVLLNSPKGISNWSIGVSMVDSTKLNSDTIYSVKNNKAYMSVKTVFQSTNKEWWSSTTTFQNTGQTWHFYGASIEREEGIFFGLSSGTISLGTFKATPLYFSTPTTKKSNKK